MPHSSGGGSHSGGSHSSHSSHSRSSGGSYRNEPVVYDTYHPGTHRYVYYHNKQPHFYYSAGRVSNGINSTRIFLIIFMAIWILFEIPFCSQIVHVPHKITPVSESVSILDKEDVFTDMEERRLYEELTSFKEQTGITPSIATINNSEWEDYYNNLENYAYDLYVNNYADETHWLIIYSTDNNTANFEKWYFEGMQGNDTDSILTSKITAGFNDTLNKLLTARGRYTVGDAFISSFEQLSDHVMETSFQLDDLVFMLIFTVVGLGIPLSMLIAINKTAKETKLKGEAVQCPSATDPVDLVKCDYCDGIYVYGLHLSCPHCGAAVKIRPASATS